MGAIDVSIFNNLTAIYKFIIDEASIQRNIFMREKKRIKIRLFGFVDRMWDYVPPKHKEKEDDGQYDGKKPGKVFIGVYDWISCCSTYLSFQCYLIFFRA